MRRSRSSRRWREAHSCAAARHNPRMPSQREQVAVPWPAVGGISGAALMMLGSFLTWFEVETALQSTSTSGLDAGDGKILVLLALGIAAVSGLVLSGTVMPSLVAKVPALLGLIGLVVAFLNYKDYSERADEVSDMFVQGSIGSGIYVAGIGALVALVSGAVKTAPARRADQQVD